MKFRAKPRADRRRVEEGLQKVSMYRTSPCVERRQGDGRIAFSDRRSATRVTSHWLWIMWEAVKSISRPLKCDQKRVWLRWESYLNLTWVSVSFEFWLTTPESHFRSADQEESKWNSLRMCMTRPVRDDCFRNENFLMHDNYNRRFRKLPLITHNNLH